MNEYIAISDHARQRIKERCGTNKKAAAERQCLLAIERGICSTQTKGSVRKWADAKLEGQNDMQLFLYGDKAYLFGVSNMTFTLVTVLQLPTEIARTAAKNRKKALPA